MNKNEKLLNAIGNIDDELIENAVKEKRVKKTMKLWQGWKVFATCAACMVVLCFGLFGTMALYNNATVGSLTIDVNPSIELSLVRNGKVKDVNYINEDAEKAFEGVKLCRDNVESFLTQVIEQYKELGYVLGDNNTILVSYDQQLGKNENLKNKIEQSITKALENTYSGEIFFHQNSDSKEVTNFANEHQISKGKAEWVLSTANKTGQKPEDLVSSSVEELGQWQEEKPVPFGSLFIGMTKAKQIAINDAGVSSRVTFITEKFYNGGIKTPYYLLEFCDKTNYWKYRIDATSCDVLEKEHSGDKVEAFITLEKAKQSALDDANLTESVKVVFTEEYLSRNNGRPCYVFSFYTEDKHNLYFHYKIDAKDGTIIESRYIGLEKAIQIALADAGVSTKVEILKTLLIDGGIKTPYYNIEFKNAQATWSYYIDATNGDIMKKDKTDVTTVTMISMDEAKQIAKQDAILDTGLQDKVEMVFTKEELLRNNGEPYYALIFSTSDNQYYYYYEIDAYTGDILTTRYIGMAKAKQIALKDAAPEDKVVFTTTLLIDGGIKTPYYQLDFENAQAIWSYNIDATNGSIMKKDKKDLAAVAMITMDEAKEIAVQHAILDTGLQDKVEMVFTKEELWRNSGEPYYALAFNTKDNKYFHEYKIDACSGEILATRYIGMEKAKQIATKDANVAEKVVFTTTTLTDNASKSPYYTIEFTSDGIQFSYEIEATNGAILKSSKS